MSSDKEDESYPAPQPDQPLGLGLSIFDRILDVGGNIHSDPNRAQTGVTVMIGGPPISNTTVTSQERSSIQTEQQVGSYSSGALNTLQVIQNSEINLEDTDPFSSQPTATHVEFCRDEGPRDSIYHTVVAPVTTISTKKYLWPATALIACTGQDKYRSLTKCHDFRSTCLLQLIRKIMFRRQGICMHALRLLRVFPIALIRFKSI
jgi:hypothetical protein